MRFVARCNLHQRDQQNLSEGIPSRFNFSIRRLERTNGRTHGRRAKVRRFLVDVFVDIGIDGPAGRCAYSFILLVRALNAKINDELEELKCYDERVWE